jgi:hypothetical protein
VREDSGPADLGAADDLPGGRDPATGRQVAELEQLREQLLELFAEQRRAMAEVRELVDSLLKSQGDRGLARSPNRAQASDDRSQQTNQDEHYAEHHEDPDQARPPESHDRSRGDSLTTAISPGGLQVGRSPR